MKSRHQGTIDEYIAEFPASVRARLEQIRMIVKKAAPGASEAIKYQIPTFVMGRNLLHFAAYPKHIGFYPTPSVIAKFASELSAFRVAKGSVQFPLDRPLPIGLIRRMVSFRVRELETQTAA